MVKYKILCSFADLTEDIILRDTFYKPSRDKIYTG